MLIYRSCQQIENKSMIVLLQLAQAVTAILFLPSVFPRQLPNTKDVTWLRKNLLSWQGHTDTLTTLAAAAEEPEQEREAIAKGGRRAQCP